MQDEEDELRKLVQLIRSIARDLIYEILDEHLENYEHKERPAEETEEN